MRTCLINAILMTISLSALANQSGKGERVLCLSADSTHIVYDVYGERMPTLVFVHGWSCDRSYWMGQLESFSRFRVVAIDLAGHGESGLGHGAWTMKAFGQDVAAVVKKLDLQRVILIGQHLCKQS